MTHYKRLSSFALVAIALLMVAVAASIGLMGHIDAKLKQSAEQQVITFTRQAAGNVADRVFVIQNALSVFTVQSADPEDVVPALAALQERFGFTDIAFAGMDGVGRHGDGSEFHVSEVKQKETALSLGEMTFSDTYENGDGVRVRLAQRPVEIEGEQVGALYVQVPLDRFVMPSNLDMFDGRGYFLLFQRRTGEILVRPQEETLTPIESDTTLYDFLDAASKIPIQGPSSDVFVSPRFVGSRVQELQSMVADKEAGLVTGGVDGKECYVCVSPVGRGQLYVCNVIPVENVRAEGVVVATAFKAVFTISVVCIAVAAAAAFLYYRRHQREKNMAMKTRLYDALSDSLDLSVSLYSPSDGVVTRIAAKENPVLDYPLQELGLAGESGCEAGLSDKGEALLARVRDGSLERLEQGECSFCNEKTGAKHWLAFSARPLSYEDKDQILLAVRDVSVEKKMQLSMKEAMVAADAANRAKSEFLSRMSHEIRTPMNVIIGMLNIAQRSLGDTAKMQRTLDKIAMASEHLLSLINDVLDISKIESGKMVLSNEPFCLGGVIAYLQEVAKSQCEEKGQTLVVDVQGDTAETFMGDAVRLRQLLVNLLSNAAKYTPEGGHVRFAAMVRPSAAVACRTVTFVVADDGIGMEPAFCEHMFEPFAMEGRSASAGTGLGMAIVKNIVSLMGGDLQVETQVGKGTTFTVVLDLRVALDPGRCLVESGLGRQAASGERCREKGATEIPPTAWGGGLAQHAERFAEGCAEHPATAALSGKAKPLAGLRVLLAEDNELNVEVARELLGEEGASIDWAPDGLAACRLFEEAPPGTYDVVLMDVQMPQLDGYGATRCIRSLQREDAATVPIVAMSANAFAEDVRASLEAGMNAHLSKPIDMRKVVDTLVRLTRKGA